MDPVEEQSLRAAGARIGDANRQEWIDLVAKHTMSDLTWAVAATKERIGRYPVPFDLTGALKQRMQRQVQAAAAATTVASRPKISTPTTALVRNQPRPKEDQEAKRLAKAAIDVEILTAIAEREGKAAVDDLADLLSMTTLAVKQWLSAHRTWVEQRIEYPNGRSTTFVRLSTLGWDQLDPTIAARNAAVPLAERTTPILQSTGKVNPRHLAPAQPAPELDPTPERPEVPADQDPPSECPADPLVSIEVHDDHGKTITLEVPTQHGPVLLQRSPPWHTDTNGRVFPNPDPVKPPIPAERSLEIAPLVAELSTQPGTLEHDLAVLLRKHVTNVGYAATMKALSACRYLLGLGQ